MTSEPPDLRASLSRMRTVAFVLIGLVAALHAAFFVLETFLWRSRAGRAFGLSDDEVKATARLAANQGLYNGFLAAGLIWALVSGPQLAARATFFLACVAVAGVFGALTVRRTIFFVQAAPALAALAALAAAG